MAPHLETQDERSDRLVYFATTHWSVILLAGQSETEAAQAALARLCESYWYPVYAFVRRSGNGPTDTLDLTQEFFLRLLEREFFGQADPARGRFRSFLLAALRNFLRETWRNEHRARRGGGMTFVPLDATASEGRYEAEPADNASPDRLYERRYALALLESVLVSLRRDYAKSGRGELFEQLQRYLWGREATISYAEMAARLELTKGAVKVAVHRLRGRYRELLLEAVAQTVASQTEVEEELRHLVQVVSG